MTESMSGPGAQVPLRQRAETLLEVRDLRLAYRSQGHQVEVVHGIDLRVAPGEVVALVGESGSGKSTTALAIIDLLPAGGCVTGGTILLGSRDISHLSAAEMRGVRGREVGLIPQDPMTSLNPVKRIGDQIAEALLVHGLADRDAAHQQAVEMLERAGFSDPAARARQFPHQLSGGMCQRVLIAMAFSCRPRLVIADEPTSALDVTVQRRILDHIEEINAASGTAMLLITHDLGIAADRADSLVVMSKGRLVERGPTRDVLRAPQHPYTQHLLDSAPSLVSRRAAHLAGGPDERPQEAASPLVRVEGLRRHYVLPDAENGTRLLRAVDGVSFAIERAQTLALVGESGSGKSTTARLVARLDDATAGQIQFDGTDVTAAGGGDLRRLRRRVQIVYQNPYASLDPRFTVGSAVEEPLRAFKIGDRSARRRKVSELLERVALPSDVIGRKARELSGGQRQRVAIARAIALDPELVIFDEPVSALDVSVQAQILDLIAGLQRDLSLTFLFISHDLAVVRQISHTIAVMRNGRIVETGETLAVFENPQDPYTQALLAAIPGNRDVAGA